MSDSREVESSRIQIETLWRVIRDWLQENRPGALNGLRGPAPSFALEEICARWGLDENEGLLQSLAAIDGDDESFEFAFGGYNHLLSVAEIVALADRETAKALKRNGLNRVPDGQRVRTIGAVRPAFWGSSWIPFMRSNVIPYCIDLDPLAGGIRGQVIKVDKEDNIIIVIAPSYAQFLRTAVEAISAGQGFPFERT